MSDGAGSAPRAFPIVHARRAGLLAAIAVLLVVGLTDQARAVIVPATTIDGPSENIVGFGGVAMAEDGTGGVVYLKRVDGVAHVFVSQYVGGHWLAPIPVDTEETYAASWPRIGAADGGELVVVWATPFATEDERPVDELLGATLGAGSDSFGQATIVDPDIGEGTGTSPDLAMSSTGQADVVYRVVDFQSSIPLLRPKDVDESVRLAAYDGERWTALGAINRDPGVSMRAPTEANAPQIAVGPTGNGIVVWQEPELDGVARIWARRLFGASLDYVMPVTATSLAGTPLDGEANAPSVAISRLGQAEVAYRQEYETGSALPGPRVFLNTLPDGESESGDEFKGAIVADTAVSGGANASVGRPSVDLDEHREVRLLYDSNGTPRVITGNEKGLTAALSLGPSFAGDVEPKEAKELSAASVMDPEGGGVSAWPSENTAHQPGVAVREDFPDGAVQTALVSGGAGGPIGELAVGRSTLGDGLVAFQQGATGNAAIVASQVSAPPEPFVISVPKGWVEPDQTGISWQPAASANGPLSYAVVLDGKELAVPAGALSYSFPAHALTTGAHEVQLLATDMFGQAVLTPPTALDVDGRPPLVAITRARHGSGVTVRVSDPWSGVDTAAVSVSFGDGHTASRHAVFHHRYARAGVYELVVHVRDHLGNTGIVTKLVKVG
jgi:hypothetical protein